MVIERWINVMIVIEVVSFFLPERERERELRSFRVIVTWVSNMWQTSNGLCQSVKISPKKYKFFRVHKGKHLSFASHVTPPLQLLELLDVERDADVVAYSNEVATVFTHKKKILFGITSSGDKIREKVKTVSYKICILARFKNMTWFVSVSTW